MFKHLRIYYQQKGAKNDIPYAFKSAKCHRDSKTYRVDEEYRYSEKEREQRGAISPFMNILWDHNKSKTIGWQSVFSGHFDVNAHIFDSELLHGDIVWINNLMGMKMFILHTVPTLNPKQHHKLATILSNDIFQNWTFANTHTNKYSSIYVLNMATHKYRMGSLVHLLCVFVCVNKQTVAWAWAWAQGHGVCLVC